jgi:hypothetical protein
MCTRGCVLALFLYIYRTHISTESLYLCSGSGSTRIDYFWASRIRILIISQGSGPVFILFFNKYQINTRSLNFLPVVSSQTYHIDLFQVLVMWCFNNLRLLTIAERWTRTGSLQKYKESVSWFLNIYIARTLLFYNADPSEKNSRQPEQSTRTQQQIYSSSVK